MVRDQWKKISEKGSIMIEAMAMLALISMVTPILYKKAAERTTEIRDINAASEMRGLIRAVDDYLKDNYQRIINGDTVTLADGLTTKSDAKSFSWAEFKTTTPAPTTAQERSITVPIEHFAEYLPYGFLDENGLAQPSRNFRSYEVVVTSVESPTAGGDATKQVLTGFVLGRPSEGGSFPMMRASRIASMIGSNGGYAIADDKVSGAQGIWGIDSVSSSLGLNGVTAGDILTASIQSVSSGGGDYEDVLYRKPRSNHDLNTMSTTLWMGDNSIRNANQMIITARSSDADMSANQANALLLFNDGALKPGARIQGRLAAALSGGTAVKNTNGDVVGVANIREQFLVDETGKTMVDQPFQAGLTSPDGARQNDKYNLAVFSSAVQVQNERLHVGGALEVFPTVAGTDRATQETVNQVTGSVTVGSNAVNPNTRVKINAPSGVIMDSQSAQGTTSFDINGNTTGTMGASKGGIVGYTVGSVNFLTTESAPVPAGTIGASLRLGGGQIGANASTGEVGMGTGELYGARQVSMGTVLNNTLPGGPNTLPGRMLQRIKQDTSQLTMTGPIWSGSSEAKLESDFVDIVTTNYNSNSGGSLIALQKKTDDDSNWDEIYLESGSVHLFAREDMHLEVEGNMRLEADQNMGLTAKSIYNQFEGDGNAVGTDSVGSYHISAVQPRNGAGGPGVVNYDTLYMDQGFTNMANRTKITLQSDKVDIGNFGMQPTGNDITFFAPVVSVHGEDKTAYNKYGSGIEPAGTPNAGQLQMIHIKRGAIEIGRNSPPSGDKSDPRSYIQVDRMRSNETWSSMMAPKDGSVVNGSASTPYDEYQVNPAYTSVMHDIKLTTRGGARLSDILPDFINKGIYVVDTTFKEAVGNWEGFTINTSGGTPSVNTVMGTPIEVDAHVTNNADYAVSPWTGFVPKPQCPPGYARVITVIPAGIAMSQAGQPTFNGTTLGIDLKFPNDITANPLPFSPTTGYGMDPLFFQKNTWFRAKAYTHYTDGCQGNTCNPANFQGWSVILGFIYPWVEYQNYLGRVTGRSISFDLVDPDNTMVIWNLFPVYRKELEAYATVYCYFDRLDSAYSSSFVDKYDQINNYRFGNNKGYDTGSPSSYQLRLNDPTLKYNDPW